ncbi:MAG: hypothetical protein COV47_00130 [Candidatus Diapherotrites archaeon CG11_big_fil_rev_8_21_14_0_20_37_9]|nr:MAG: hypothetical protein COV47_00130 [Candidatus Diapherotrites archaeon CG11_big_fil_rev_8_21_14_0_20_37_9]
MKILLPVLSEHENDSAFLETALKGAKETIILVVVDTSQKAEFGFATSQIQKARTVMEEIKNELGKKRKRSEEILEWGDPQSKILNLALLRKVDKVVLKKQENEYFEELVKKIRKENIEVEVIE